MRLALTISVFMASLAAPQAHAAEDAVLFTGLSIRADRHELQGDRVLLYFNGGVTDLPAASIDHSKPIWRA